MQLIFKLCINTQTNIANMQKSEYKTSVIDHLVCEYGKNNVFVWKSLTDADFDFFGIEKKFRILDFDLIIKSNAVLLIIKIVNTLQKHDLVDFYIIKNENVWNIDIVNAECIAIYENSICEDICQFKIKSITLTHLPLKILNNKHPNKSNELVTQTKNNNSECTSDIETQAPKLTRKINAKSSFAYKFPTTSDILNFIIRIPIRASGQNDL